MTVSSTFLAACRKQPVDTIPVWYMRQAGRYQREYLKVREKYSLLEICRHPDICCEVTKLPVNQLGVDAAILFSDIMVPLQPMGVEFEIQERVGPVLQKPIRTKEEIERLRPLECEESLPYVLETIKMLKSDLKVPLIGFAGAPYTLASYIIEGGPSRTYVDTKRMMCGEPELWNLLMRKLSDMIVHYLTAQVHAGASAVQLFDSWVGSLAPDDYKEYVLPTMQRIFAELKPLGVPLIYFGVGTGELLSSMGDTGADVIGVDWRVRIRDARQRLASRFALQGNLDPAMLFAPWPEIERRAKDVIDAGIEEDGFIFNLGWGVLHHQPSVDPLVLRQLTTFVHEYSQRRLRALRSEK